MSSNFQYPYGKRDRSGFTIIELLVATAVTALLAGILLIMTNSVLNAWTRTSGNLSANGQAQLVFSMIREDLQASVYRRDLGVWMAVEILEDRTAISNREWTVSSASGQYKPDGNLSNNRGRDLRFTETRYGLGGAWLRFFTAAEGEPRAVAYQLARRHVTGEPDDATNPAEVRYMLYRSYMSAKDTFELGYNLDSNPFPLHPAPSAGYADPTNNLNTLTVPPRAEMIASNVIDFGIRLHSRNGTLLDPVFPVSAATLEWDENHLEYLAYGTPTEPFPDVVDVMVRILTEEGARQIENLEEERIPVDSGGFQETWWRIAEEHSEVFTQRIYVNARPL